MPVKPRYELYDRFATGNKPTHDDFVDLIDSMIHTTEDGIGVPEPGNPMEIIQQGNNRRLLDFSSDQDTPIWRINAQSASQTSGLNIASNNQSRLFIKQDNGFTGINNDSPAAKLHIIPEPGSPALQVDNKDKNPAFVVGANGEIGIGINPQGPEKFTVDGTVKLNGDVAINGELNVSQGIKVTGAALNALQGLNVQHGASISGALEANDGFTVSGAALYANDGAVISGASLEVNDGLNVNGGLIVNDTFQANGAVSLGCSDTGDVMLNGALKFGDSNIKISAISSNNQLDENSNSILPTQQAVKAYIDNRLAQKADQSEVNTALATKANQSDVDIALATKADQSAVDLALATKVDQSAMETALAAKADQFAVDTALATKADQLELEAALTTKADLSSVVTAFATKADQSSVDSLNMAINIINQTLTAKADQTVVDSLNSELNTVNQTLSAKADQTAVDSLNSELNNVNQTLGAKADQTAVDSLNSELNNVNQTLGAKADQTAVDSLNSELNTVNQTLSAKADQTAVDSLNSELSTVNQTLTTKADQSALDGVNTALASKTGLLRPNDFSVPAESTATIDGIGLTVDSRGLMMVLIKDSISGSTLGTSIFAVHGTDMVTKLAGEGMTDQQDGGTFNMFYNASGLIIQNTTTDTVTATVTYFGA